MPNNVYVIDRLNLEYSEGEADHLKVLASGITRYAGCKMPRLSPRFTESSSSQNGVYEFDFVADCEHAHTDEEEHIPTGDVLYYFKKVPGDLKTIIVYAESNKKEVEYQP